MLVRVWGYKNSYVLHYIDYSGEEFGTTLLTQRICIEHHPFVKCYFKCMGYKQ